MTTILDRLRTYARANSGQFQVCLSVAEIREIVRALEPAWQPIDSAPKDMSVLVYCAHLERPVVATQMTALEDGVVDWVYARRASLEDPVAFIARKPTHWMPLPSPPPPLSSPSEVAAFIDSMDGGTKRIEG